MRKTNARLATSFQPEVETSLPRIPEGKQQIEVGGGAIGNIVGRALSLRPRGAIGNDELVVKSLSARLRVHLLARPTHPWDCDLPANERNELFVQQCLEDVSTAIPKLFRSMPEIDEMDIIVMEPRGRRAIISGVVKRSDALASSRLSAGMKLKALGLEYGRSNSGFERLEEDAVLALD